MANLYFITSDFLKMDFHTTLVSFHDFEVKSNGDIIEYERVNSRIASAIRYEKEENIKESVNKCNILVEVNNKKSSYSSFHLEPSTIEEVRIIKYEVLEMNESTEFEPIGNVDHRSIKTTNLKIKALKIINSQTGTTLKNDIISLLRDQKLDDLLGDS
jgi:hypothetical protein